MSSVRITPSVVVGRFTAPPSRDDTLRLIWACCLGEGGAIGNCHAGPDTEAVISLGRQIGADVVYAEGVADIFSQPESRQRITLACQSPLAARFAIGHSLMGDIEVAIRTPPLPSRAMDFISALAEESGASVKPSDATSVRVKGPITAPAIPLAGQEGAFWSSSLVMASVASPVETFFPLDDFSAAQPALNGTLSALSAFDVIYTFDPAEASLLIAGDQYYKNRLLDAEGDWRNAAYAMGAILAAGQGVVEGLSKFSRQNERKAFAPLEDAGIMSWNEKGDKLILKSGSLPSMPIDPRHSPTLIPLWMALALYADTPITIGPLSPISPLSQKRIAMMVDRLQTLGATIENLSDNIIIHPSKLRGGSVGAEGDARVAMALAIAALGGTEPITIHNVEGVADTYPEFWTVLKSMGAEIVLPTIGTHIADKPML